MPCQKWFTCFHSHDYSKQRWKIPDGVTLVNLDAMGTLIIIDWCTENGNPPPKWDDQSGSVFVSFFPAVLPDNQQDGDDIYTY